MTAVSGWVRLGLEPEGILFRNSSLLLGGSARLYVLLLYNRDDFPFRARSYLSIAMANKKSTTETLGVEFPPDGADANFTSLTLFEPRVELFLQSEDV